MNIHGFITLTLLDYPEHLAASVFLGSCNLRCPFCQNGNLVLSPENEPSISEEEVLAFLKKRSGILEGVCISGGEPTLYRELPDFISKIKALGYLVKLDTNGTNPEMLRFLYENHLLDYIAMDIKTQPEQYAKVSGLQPDAAGTQKLLQKGWLTLKKGTYYFLPKTGIMATGVRQIAGKTYVFSKKRDSAEGI